MNSLIQTNNLLTPVASEDMSHPAMSVPASVPVTISSPVSAPVSAPIVASVSTPVSASVPVLVSLPVASAVQAVPVSVPVVDAKADVKDVKKALSFKQLNSTPEMIKFNVEKCMAHVAKKLSCETEGINYFMGKKNREFEIYNAQGDHVNAEAALDYSIQDAVKDFRQMQSKVDVEFLRDLCTTHEKSIRDSNVWDVVFDH
jgi:hypothetical protein